MRETSDAHAENKDTCQSKWKYWQQQGIDNRRGRKTKKTYRKGWRQSSLGPFCAEAQSLHTKGTCGHEGWASGHHQPVIATRCCTMRWKFRTRLCLWKQEGGSCWKGLREVWAEWWACLRELQFPTRFGLCSGWPRFSEPDFRSSGVGDYWSWGEHFMPYPPYYLLKGSCRKHSFQTMEATALDIR